MPESTPQRPDDLDRLYDAFREAGTNGTLEIQGQNSSLEITQGNGYLKARLYIYGAAGTVLEEIARLHDQKKST